MDVVETVWRLAEHSFLEGKLPFDLLSGLLASGYLSGRPEEELRTRVRLASLLLETTEHNLGIDVLKAGAELLKNDSLPAGLRADGLRLMARLQASRDLDAAALALAEAQKLLPSDDACFVDINLILCGKVADAQKAVHSGSKSCIGPMLTNCSKMPMGILEVLSCLLGPARHIYGILDSLAQTNVEFKEIVGMLALLTFSADSVPLIDKTIDGLLALLSSCTHRPPPQSPEAFVWLEDSARFAIVFVLLHQLYDEGGFSDEAKLMKLEAEKSLGLKVGFALFLDSVDFLSLSF